MNLDTLAKVGEKGFTDKQIAKALGVTEQTINNYKKDDPYRGDSIFKVFKELGYQTA